MHCGKSVRIRRCSGPYFPAFGLNTERSECGKILTRITPNTNTFYVVISLKESDIRWKELLNLVENDLNKL